MGWLAWERFTCDTNCHENPDECISSKLFTSMADRLVADGYRDVGYEYVNIDDCWSEKERNENEELVADKERFPGGIEKLAEYIHSRNLKLGIYGDCGTKTCAGYPAQLKPNGNLTDNNFNLDAQTFSKWEVDSFKFDGCNLDSLDAERICPQMTTAIMATRRPMIIVCEWPFYLLKESHQPNFTLAQESCNAWRYYEDIEDSWQSVLSIIDYSIQMQATIVKYHGPGHWFDPDQLVIGNFALSLDQAKAQMAIWSIWSAPLYMSNDLREIDQEMADVLKNKKLIDVNQDRLGVFGLMVAESDSGNIQAFVKPVEPIRNGCPTFVVAYLNRNTLGNRRMVSFRLTDLFSKSALIQAADRYSRLDDNYQPGGKFSGRDCRERILAAGSKTTPVGEGTVIPTNHQFSSDLRGIATEYIVEDLIETERLPPVSLNSTLDLYVNPSGVRVVKLSERIP